MSTPRSAEQAAAAGGIERLPLPEELDPAQRAAADAITAGPRGGIIGPFVPLLRTPELMTRLQLVGEHIRWHGGLADHLRELVILQVARHWDQGFEWGHHQPIALRAGLPRAVVDAIGEDTRPPSGPDDVLAVWALVDELLRTHHVGEDTYAGAVAVLGEEGVVEAVTTAGYYTTLAMVLNTARTPTDPGTPPLPARDAGR